MNYIGKIKNVFKLNQLEECNENDIAYVESEKKYYIYQNGVWGISNIKPPSNGNAEVSLYEVNKGFYTSQSPLTEEQLKEKEDIILSYHKEQKNDHYMLLCKELSYFTIFELDVRPEFSTLAKGVIDIMPEYGWKIYDIYKNENTDAIEIWIQDEHEEIHCMLFFAYDRGVVTFGGTYL